MTDPTFAVKEGATLPKRTGKPPVRIKYPFATMAVDAVFFVPDMTTRQLSTYASSRGKALGRKFTTQLADMRRDLETDEWEPCKPGALGSRRGVAIRRIA